MTHVWIDVDNPPQAQYLTPLAAAFRSAGATVAITARDHAPTLRILEQRGERATAVSGAFGRGLVAKATGTVARTARLVRQQRRERPDVVLTSSRSGVLAARALRRPCFTVLDYEGVELRSFRFSGTTILHPAVVDAERFVARGFPAERLRAFDGLKEDITFDGIDPTATTPATLPAPRRADLPAVLVRPPSESSHYRVDASLRLIRAMLDRLAEHDGVQVVFSPREPRQTAMVSDRSWRVEPVVLAEPIPFVPLLRAVDWVVTGGGTMLREAAWMGVPGVTVFQGEQPAVDRWLESIGAVRCVTAEAELDAIPWTNADDVPGIPRNAGVVDELTTIILNAARR